MVYCKDCVYYAKAVYFDDDDVKRYYPYGMCSNTGKATVKAVLGTNSCGKGIQRINYEKINTKK